MTPEREWPQVLSGLIRDAIEDVMDPELFGQAQERETQYRRAIGRLLREHGDVLDQEE